MEFLLDFLHYLYNYYMVCANHVTSCDFPLCDCDYVILSHPPFYVVSPKEKRKKKKKRNINNDLAVLPSHNMVAPSRETTNTHNSESYGTLSQPNPTNNKIRGRNPSLS